MKVKIINEELQDSIILEEKTIEEIRTSAYAEMTKRKWEGRDCWSEIIES